MTDAQQRSAWVAFGHGFTIATPEPALDAYLADLLADLPRADGPVDHRYTIEGPDASGRWVARRNGEVVVEPGTAARALALLLWCINRGVIEDTDDVLLLHAGGVVLEGAAVVLPGDMEVGKTTLVTALLRAGADYLSDEAVGLRADATDAEVHGYAKALSLDPGSWPLFPELEPDPPAPVRPYLPDQWQVRASSLPGVAAVPSAPLGGVVLPRYVPGAPLAVRRLGGAEALLRTSGCVFPTALPRRRILQRLAEVLDRVPCHELVYSRLSEGVDAVAALRREADVTAVDDGATAASAPDRDDAAVVDEAARFARRGDAAVIAVGDDRVIHVAATDELHRTDVVGAALWDRLDGDVPLRDLIDELAAASGEPRAAIASRVIPFVADLRALDLLEVVPAPGQVRTGPAPG